MRDQVYEALRMAMENESKEIRPEDVFRDYEEWDSLVQISLVAELDERLGVAISSSDFQKLKTVDDLVREVERQRSQS